MRREKNRRKGTRERNNERGGTGGKITRNQ